MTTVLGQPKAVSYLTRVAASRRPAGAFLFFGPDGVGKKLAALEFAKALNCQSDMSRQSGVACGECSSCRAAEKSIHPDITLVDFLYQARQEIKKDVSDSKYEEELEKELAKQQHISIKTVRGVLSRAQQKSSQDGWKVFIIDHAQTLQAAAANALLKFLEEPPARTIFILLTNKRFAMLRTILSRCQPVAFGPLSSETVLQLAREHQIALDNPELAARYSGGSIAGAITADKAITILQENEFGTPAASMAVAGGLSHTLVTARQEAHAVLDVLMQALHQKWISAPDAASQQKIVALLKRFETYKRSITRNVSPALVLETALMSLDGTDLSL